MILKKINLNDIASILIPLILGISAFFLVVGPRALDPTNIAWLSSGDPAQHYLGWLFYRNSNWNFPIGINSSYGMEIAAGIVYSDSIPLLAIIFKFFSFLLPETFQYSGIWVFTCFILQALFGWKLIGLVAKSKYLRLLGAGLIVFSSPMLMRLSGHWSLLGHFLILASLYLSLNLNLQRRKLYWGLLVGVAALVHAYLLAMVLIIWITDLIVKTTKSHNSWGKSSIEFLTIIFILVFTCWQAGYFSIKSGVSASGYGFYRMNLLSLFDSDGRSYIFKDLPSASGDYEGHNYLGLGLIFILTLCLPAFLDKSKYIKKFFKENYLYVLVFTLLFVFSITNSIGVGTFEFKYNLPDFIINICNTFRASGRFFWPVFYAIVFSLVVIIIKFYSYRTASIILSIALVLQILDMSGAWRKTRSNLMVESSSEWSTPLINDFWNQAAKKYKNVRRIPVLNQASDWQVFAYFAAKNGLETDSVYLARNDWNSLQNAQLNASKSVENGIYETNSLYILDDSSFRKAVFFGNASTDLFARVDGFNVVAPGWKTCANCKFLGEEVKLDDLFQNVDHGLKLGFQSSAEGTNTLITGWSNPESFGTWADSHSATIFLNTSPRKVESISIEFIALVNAVHPSQRIEIFINNFQSYSGTINNTSGTLDFKVPVSAKKNSFRGIKIEFKFPDAVKPIDIGIGNDIRLLSLGLRNIKLK